MAAPSLSKKQRKNYLKSLMNRSESDWTPFRAAEKKYKALYPPPDLSQVLDLALLHDQDGDGFLASCRGNPHATEFKQLGPRAYAIPRIPGLAILPGFIGPEQQRHLVRWALRDHAKAPNETNLDTHYIIPPEGIWNMADQETVIQPRATLSDEPAQDQGPRQLINNPPASPSTLTKTPAPPSTTVKPTPASQLIHKLRWANIGWSYHWGSKSYDFTKGNGGGVDPDVRRLCRDAVEAVDWEQVFGGDWTEWKLWAEDYEPDAGIVNFYQINDTLMAHVDRSEVCATSPLVSISLGHAAIFLIGGQSREEEPLAILLRSGDVVIMAGPECRRAYHGVPRILANTLPKHMVTEEEEEWSHYKDYLQSARINVNVRQVFPKGFKPPETGQGDS